MTDPSTQLSPEDQKLVTLARATRARHEPPPRAPPSATSTAGPTPPRPSPCCPCRSPRWGRVAMAVASGARGLEAAVLLTGRGPVSPPQDLGVLSDFAGAGVTVHVGDHRGDVGSIDLDPTPSRLGSVGPGDPGEMGGHGTRRRSTGCARRTPPSRRASPSDWPSGPPTSSVPGRSAGLPDSTCPVWTASSRSTPGRAPPTSRACAPTSTWSTRRWPHGLIPLVVPQLRTITLGGAVTGLGIESTQLPQRPAARVGDRDGRLHRRGRGGHGPAGRRTCSTRS